MKNTKQKQQIPNVINTQNSKISHNNKSVPKICKWFVKLKDDILLISTDKSVISIYEKKELIRENYHNSIFYRYPGTSSRISETTIRKKYQNCNVIY